MDNFFYFEALIFLLSGFVHSILGFGFPMLATPLLSTFLSIKEAVLLTLFPNIAINFKVVKRSSSFKILWAEYKFLILPLIFGSFVGTNILIMFQSEYYKIILAFMTLLYLNKTYINFSLQDILQSKPKEMMVLFGLISGIIGGMVNVMLPLLIIYAIESNIEKEKSFGLMNFCFFSSKITQVFVFSLYGNLSLEFSFIAVPIVIISLIGFYLGGKIRGKLSEVLYKKILITTLWIVSFYLIVDSLS